MGMEVGERRNIMKTNEEYRLLEQELARERSARTAVEDLLHKQAENISDMEQQLADHKKLLLLAKQEFEDIKTSGGQDECGSGYSPRYVANRTLAAINDSKLVGDLRKSTRS
jgi:hypothetical protein